MTAAVTQPRLAFDRSKLLAFCEMWDISRFEFFGSVLREDFGPQSDIDCMVTFGHAATWTLLDIVDMKEELEALFGRTVDLVERRAVENSSNPYRRPAILGGARDVLTR